MQRLRREYAPWADAPVRVDSVRPLDEVVGEVLTHVRSAEQAPHGR